MGGLVWNDEVYGSPFNDTMYLCGRQLEGFVAFHYT